MTVAEAPRDIDGDRELPKESEGETLEARENDLLDEPVGDELMLGEPPREALMLAEPLPKDERLALAVRLPGWLLDGATLLVPDGEPLLLADLLPETDGELATERDGVADAPNVDEVDGVGARVPLTLADREPCGELLNEAAMLCEMLRVAVIEPDRVLDGSFDAEDDVEAPKVADGEDVDNLENDRDGDHDLLDEADNDVLDESVRVKEADADAVKLGLPRSDAFLEFDALNDIVLEIDCEAEAPKLTEGVIDDCRDGDIEGEIETLSEELKVRLREPVRLLEPLRENVRLGENDRVAERLEETDTVEL